MLWRSKFPFIPPFKREADAASLWDASFIFFKLLDPCPRRIRVSFREVGSQASAGRGPDPASRVFNQLANTQAGKPLINAIFHPPISDSGVLERPNNSTI